MCDVSAQPHAIASLAGFLGKAAFFKACQAHSQDCSPVSAALDNHAFSMAIFPGSVPIHSRWTHFFIQNFCLQK